MVSVQLPDNVLRMRVHVAFTPAEATRVPTGIVVDVLRATSTIVQALDSGYREVYCCTEIDDARALKEELPDAVLGGEHGAEPIPGFDFGNSPRDFLHPRAGALVLTTTNGTRAIVAAAADCELILAGSLLNLDAVVGAARERGKDIEVVCAGVQGQFTPDDAYCAARIVERLDCERSGAAEEAVRLASSFANAEEAFREARVSGETIDEHDLLWCAQEDVCSVAPRFVALRGPAARLVAG
jgi:2-phosphosulfolactate phosphatase